MDKTVDNIKPFDFKDIYGFMKNSGKCFSTSAYKVLFSNVKNTKYSQMVYELGKMNIIMIICFIKQNTCVVIKMMNY